MSNEIAVTVTPNSNVQATISQLNQIRVAMSQPGPPGSGVGALLKDYTILGQLPEWAGDVTLDMQHGNVVQPTMTGNVTSLAILGWPDAGIEAKVALYIPCGATPYTLAGWPAAVKWIGGVAPILSSTPGEVDIIVLASVDGGVTIFGFFLGTAN